MAMNPRIEEVSDSESEHSDPSDMDPSDFAPTPSSALMRPSAVPASVESATAARQSQAAAMAAHREKTKHYQCLYPVYFDSGRSKSQGRRVPSALATPNPLARGIVDALQSPALMIPGGQIVFEPGKLHPKDWANPGRVRILLRGEDGRDRTNGRVKNKEDLIRKVAKYLQEHPTTEDDPKKLQIRGLPIPEDGVPKPNVPRGVKMGTILPLHSPALSGGGVDEDMMKDMLKGMQGMAGGAGGANPLASMLGGLGGGGGMPGFGGAGGPPGGQMKKVKASKKGK